MKPIETLCHSCGNKYMSGDDMNGICPECESRQNEPQPLTPADIRLLLEYLGENPSDYCWCEEPNYSGYSIAGICGDCLNILKFPDFASSHDVIHPVVMKLCEDDSNRMLLFKKIRSIIWDDAEEAGWSCFAWYLTAPASVIAEACVATIKEIKN